MVQIIIKCKPEDLASIVKYRDDLKKLMDEYNNFFYIKKIYIILLFH